MFSDTGHQYFQGIGVAPPVEEESLEQSGVLILPESDRREVSSVIDGYFPEVLEDGEAVVADSLIKRA